jgi:2'-5' RNA ligase
MTIAIQLFFDEAGEARIRDLWSRLEQAGVPRLARFATPEYRPHLALGVVTADDLGDVLPDLRSATADALDLELTLTGFGFFVDPGRTLAFLTVIPSTELLAVHRDLAEALGKAGLEGRPHYAPGGWTPHCTLPYDAADPGRIVLGVPPRTLPVTARVTAVGGIHLESETLFDIGGAAVRR